MTGYLSTPGPVEVVPMRDEHATDVLSIYRAGIDEGNATFETTVPTWATFTGGKITELSRVASDNDRRVLGWVAAGPVSSRPCYRGVVEHSVYVSPSARGLGVARALMETLIDAARAHGIWTIQSSIFPENTASATLHASLGFRTVGRRERIAEHHGRWRDTVLIELRL